MDTQQGTTRQARLIELRARDGILCFHPDCRKPFSNLTADIEITKENLALFEDITFDHWNPRSRGGTWDIENLRMMHKRCNALKGDTVPNDDGTITALNRPNSAARRLAQRNRRVEVCKTCNSGRLLGPDEHCDTCGAIPMPYRHPQWAKMAPKDCDHRGVWWCWACMSGVIIREPAIVDVLGGADDIEP